MYSKSMIIIFTKYIFLTLFSMFCCYVSSFSYEKTSRSSLRTDNLGESDVETFLDSKDQGSLLDRAGVRENNIERELTDRVNLLFLSRD